MGLYTQQDPIGIAGGLNLYGYANGDPINFSDPFGLKVEFENELFEAIWALIKLYAQQASRSDDARISRAGFLLSNTLSALEEAEETYIVGYAQTGFGLRPEVPAGTRTGDPGYVGTGVRERVWDRSSDNKRAEILAHEAGHAFAYIAGGNQDRSANALHNAFRTILNCQGGLLPAHNQWPAGADWCR